MASGYVLIRFDGADPVTWHAVRDLCGEHARFMGGEFPLPVADAEIEKLRARCLTDDGLMPLPEAAELDLGLVAGDRVRVVAGPFTSFLGPVVWADDKGCKVGLNVFGRDNPVWFPHGDNALEVVEKAADRNMRTPQYGRRNRIEATV